MEVKKQNKNSFLEKSLPDKIVTIYVCLMFTIFPLFMWNKYFDIKESKAFFFLIITGAVFVITAFVAKESETAYFGLIKNYKLYLLFLITILAGAFLCEDFLEAFTGSEGRINGVLTMLEYLLAGSLIVCYSKYEKYFAYLLECTGIVVCILGILNHYKIDPLHVYDKVEKSRVKMYLSTFGHVNIYTSFLAILLPLFAVLFYIAKRKRAMAFHLIGYVVASAALVISGSDSGYLSLLMLFAVLFFRSIRLKKGKSFAKLLILLLAFTMVVGGVAILSPGKKGKKKRYDSITKAMINLDFNRVSEYFTFDDDWGSGRGFIWRQGVSYYKELPLTKKLVGVGADRIFPAMQDFCGKESLEKFDVYYDNIHCELLQNLITFGALGTLFITLFILKILYQIWKHSREDDLCFIVFAMMMCYGLQSFVNISTISVKGILVIWVFFALKRLTKEEKHNSIKINKGETYYEEKINTYQKI